MMETMATLGGSHACVESLVPTPLLNHQGTTPALERGDEFHLALAAAPTRAHCGWPDSL